ncbi:MAG: polysaccharide pyruvyl transferase family protein [Caldilineaceae bacterium]|nr:polysaccharide pyruvyl transferase family protein [Caldilineaceae bacterium]
MKILLIGMFGLYNRGCEAIVWGSLDILRRVYPDADITVAVGTAEGVVADRARLPELDVDIIPFVQPATLLQRIRRKVERNLPGATKFQPPVWGFPLHGWDLILEVGGDTFVASGAEWRLLGDKQLMAKTGTPLGLWGMNFDPSFTLKLPQSDVIDTLKRYKLIAVRDESSRKYLEQLGVRNNVYKMADPAFAMDSVPWDLNNVLPKPGELGIVGLNLSPFAASVRKTDSAGIVEFTESVTAKLINAGFGVLLVPHCFPPACPAFDDDLAVLQPVFDKLCAATPHVGILPAGISSPQVKYAISQCTLFAGARMHSTIAAWSTGVPVLTLSYSAKSRHLNEAIYGHDHYLVDISQTTPQEICDRLVEMSGQMEIARSATHSGVQCMKQDTEQMIVDLRQLF